MLHNCKLKKVIWTPYKSYSTTLRSYFINSYQSEWGELIGPSLYAGIEFKKNGGYTVHTNAHPCYYEDDTEYILPIRNPYDRVLSAWKFQYRIGNINNFRDWFWSSGKDLAIGPVTKYYRHNTLLKVENIEEELKKMNLHLGYPLPKLNTSPNPLNYELTQEDKDLIYFLHYEDFVAGGYEK